MAKKKSNRSSKTTRQQQPRTLLEQFKTVYEKTFKETGDSYAALHQALETVNAGLSVLAVTGLSGQLEQQVLELAEYLAASYDLEKLISVIEAKWGRCPQVLFEVLLMQELHEDDPDHPIHSISDPLKKLLQVFDSDEQRMELAPFRVLPQQPGEPHWLVTMGQYLETFTRTELYPGMDDDLKKETLLKLISVFHLNGIHPERRPITGKRLTYQQKDVKELVFKYDDYAIIQDDAKGHELFAGMYNAFLPIFGQFHTFKELLDFDFMDQVVEEMLPNGEPVQQGIETAEKIYHIPLHSLNFDPDQLEELQDVILPQYTQMSIDIMAMADRILVGFVETVLDQVLRDLTLNMEIQTDHSRPINIVLQLYFGEIVRSCADEVFSELNSVAEECREIAEESITEGLNMVLDGLDAYRFGHDADFEEDLEEDDSDYILAA